MYQLEHYQCLVDRITSKLQMSAATSFDSGNGIPSAGHQLVNNHCASSLCYTGAGSCGKLSKHTPKHLIEQLICATTIILRTGECTGPIFGVTAFAPYYSFARTSGTFET